MSRLDPMIRVSFVLLFVLVSLGSCAPAGGGAVGNVMPEISGMTIDGSLLDTSTLNKRPVIVNFWASWCVPCRDEFPILRDAAERQPDVQVVGVLFKDSVEQALNFARAQSADWPTVVDDGQLIAKSFRVIAVPQTFFVDAQGTIRAIQFGELTPKDLERMLSMIVPSS